MTQPSLGRPASSTVERAIVYLGIGSNLPIRDDHLDSAVDALSRLLSAVTESTRYESLPRYYEHQPDYLNSVVVGVTDLEPFELLDNLHSIEAAEGRDRTHSIRMGPRSLDIDILLYGDLVIDSPELMVPHRRLYERKFVLVPLLELAPELIDPVSGIPLFDFFTKLEDQGIYYHSLDVFQD